MKPYKVVIVDDHSLFAESLKNLINDFLNYKVDYILSNGQELMDRLDSDDNYPDIILLDINMPLVNGVETMRWLKNNYPQLMVLALSMDDHEEVIIQMLRYGAKGYLLKDIYPEELEHAFNEVIKKGFYYTDKVNSYLLKSLGMYGDQNSKNEGHKNMNDRELTFLELACTEKTYKEIADEMCISIKTVDGYRDSLFKKFGVSNRIGLVLFALKHKFVTV